VGTISDGAIGSTGSTGSFGSMGSNGSGGSGAVIPWVDISFTGWTAAVGGENGADNGSFTGIPIGDASSDRLVVFVISKWNGVPSSTTSCTINGSAANLASSASNNSANRIQAVYWLKVTTGTTCSMSFTGGGGADTYQVSAYIVRGQTTDTPYYEYFSAAQTTTSSFSTPSLAKCSILACAGSGGVFSSSTWSSPMNKVSFNPATSGTYRGSHTAATALGVEGVNTITVVTNINTEMYSIIAWR